MSAIQYGHARLSASLQFGISVVARKLVLRRDVCGLRPRWREIGIEPGQCRVAHRGVRRRPLGHGPLQRRQFRPRLGKTEMRVTVGDHNAKDNITSAPPSKPFHRVNGRNEANMAR